MPDRLRALAVLLELGFRAAPGTVVALFAAQLGARVLGLASLYGIKLVIDAIVRGDADGAIAAGVLIAVTEGLAYMCWRLHYLTREVEERAGLLIDRRLMALTTGIAGVEHHERPEYADRVELLRADRRELAAMTNAVVFSLSSAIQLVGAALLLASVSPWLLLLTPLGGAPLLTGRWANAIRQRAREATAERTRLRQHLFEMATSAAAGKELRVFGAGSAIAARHAVLAREIAREDVRASWRSRAIDGAGNLLFTAGFVGAVAFVLLRAIAGQTMVGDVLLTVRLAGELNNAVTGILWAAMWLTRVLAAAKRYLWLVDYAAAQSPAPTRPAPVPDRLAEGIELRGVSFRYPDTETPVLTDVSLLLPAGKVVALVGENGAGKTTLVKLLCRFYAPDAGAIRVDGVDLRDLDPDAWRGRIAAGFQDFCRLELLAREAVGVGDLPHVASLTHVDAALAHADARDVVASLPARHETQLGTAWENGVELSGGQWQKLALARGFMREEPLLLVLDEPTAALDAETEHALFERFAAAARTRPAGMTLLVSHRFSTVRMADLIVVLDKGRVVEQGTHDQLIARDGTYAALYRLQARGYTSA